MIIVLFSKALEEGAEEQRKRRRLQNTIIAVIQFH
jgi:hypothetical protein